MIRALALVALAAAAVAQQAPTVPPAPVSANRHESLLGKSWCRRKLYDAAAAGAAKHIERLLRDCKRQVDDVLDDKNAATPLFAASARNHLKAVEALLAGGADGFEPREDLTTPIYVAAEHSNIDVLRALLRRQRSASPPPPAHAPLLIALVAGQHAAAHALLDVGVDVDAPLTPSDRLPVYVAAEFGRAKPLERLLKQGASPTKGGKEDFVGASPLYVAARNGHMPCVMLLLTYGSPADGPPDAHFTPLLGAIEGDQGTVAKVLVSHGADANRRSAVDGATPLYAAAYNGNLELMDLLVGAGADPEASGRHGHVALTAAASQGHDDCVQFLLDQHYLVDEDADASSLLDDGRNALFLAAQAGRATTVGLLASVGAAVDATSFDGATPLVAAAAAGHHDTVETLLRHGAVPEQHSRGASSALVVAADAGHAATVDVLARHGADVERGFPLLDAVKRNSVEVVSVLLRHGASVNRAHARSGATPACVAARAGHVELLQRLHRAGADVDASCVGLVPRALLPEGNRWPPRLAVLGAIVATAVAFVLTRRATATSPRANKRRRRKVRGTPGPSIPVRGSEQGVDADRAPLRTPLGGNSPITPPSAPQPIRPPPVLHSGGGGRAVPWSEPRPRRPETDKGFGAFRMPLAPPLEVDSERESTTPRWRGRRGTFDSEPRSPRTPHTPHSAAMSYRTILSDCSDAESTRRRAPALAPVTPRRGRAGARAAEEGAHERKQGDDRLVAQILDMLGLAQELLPLFRQRGIDDDALMELTAPDLRRLGVAPGAALDVLGAVRAAKKERALDEDGVIDDVVAHQDRLEKCLRDHRRRLRRLRIGQDEIPDDMICPISFEVMKDPVMAQDGHTYERVCIEEWFQTGARTSPQTNEPLESTKLVPNHALRKMIATFLETRAEFVDAVGDLSPWVTPKSAKGRRRRFGQPAADRPSLKLGRARSRPTTPRGASPLRQARTAPSSMPLRRSPARSDATPPLRRSPMRASPPPPSLTTMSSPATLTTPPAPMRAAIDPSPPPPSISTLSSPATTLTPPPATMSSPAPTLTPPPTNEMDSSRGSRVSFAVDGGAGLMPLLPLSPVPQSPATPLTPRALGDATPLTPSLPPAPPSPTTPLTPRAVGDDGSPFTLAGLARFTPTIRKNMIGERLYRLIHPSQPELAGKLTGMLLDLDNGDLLVLLESPEDLRTKVDDALAVLQEAATPRPAPAPAPAREEPPAADAAAAPRPTQRAGQPPRSPRAADSPPPPPNPRSGRSRREGGATTDAPPRGGRPPRSPARIPEQAADDGETTPPPSRGRRRGRRKPRADESPATPSTPAGTPTTPATPSTPADSPRTPADGTTRNHRRRRRRSGSQPET